MEWFNYFIVQNYLLIVTIIIVVVNLLQYYRLNKRVSLYSLAIIGMTILLAISVTMENYARSLINLGLTTFFSVMGYIIRPIIIVLFVLMSRKKKFQKKIYFAMIPLVINFMVFMLCFVPNVNDLVVHYFIGEDGLIHFGGGPLRYTCHIVGALYLAWWFYVSIKQMQRKHFNQGITIFICAIFVVLTVLIETFINADGNVYLLNGTIGLGVLAYYLYSYTETTQIDPLTGLFNRQTYYIDLPRMKKSITGVVQFDLNGLKYLNDNFGHEAGDLALSTVAEVIKSHAKGKLYAYRVGGDEFVVLCVDASEEDIIVFVRMVKNELSKTDYHCSIGYSYNYNKVTPLEVLIKDAEEKMYLDKEEFYKTSTIERRRGQKA